jgi:hypothetical protein
MTTSSSPRQDYTFERATAPAAPASVDELAEDGGVHAHMLGEIEPLDSDEESDLSCEQHTGGVDGGDIYSTFSSALPQEEGGAAWVRVDTVPAIDRTLKGAGIMFRFGDQVGWCVGRVKRFYSTRGG